MSKLLPMVYYKNYHKVAGYLKLEEVFTLPTVITFATICSKGFMNKDDTYYFMKDLYGSSLRLMESVLDESFQPKYYREKVISERGKTRTIKPPSFQSKIVQKILNEYIVRPLLEARMISTSYASVRNKSPQKMYNDVLRGLNNSLYHHSDQYVVITDYSNYFGSIPIVKLEHTFRKLIWDERIVDLILKFMPGEVGLSLGNELSQVPASFYPTPVDLECKTIAKRYYRFQDDTLGIVDNDDIKLYIRGFLKKSEELSLNVKKEKIKVIPIKHDIKFCKENFYVSHNHYYRMLNYKRVTTEKRKLPYVTQQQFMSVRNALKAAPNSYNIISDLDDAWEQSRKEVTQDAQL